MKKLAKRVIAILITILMLCSTMAVSMTSVSAASNYFASGTKLFLKPNSNWLAKSKTFVAYCSGDADMWLPMEDLDEDGYYKAEVPYKAAYNVTFYCVPAGTAEFDTSKAIYKSAVKAYDGKNNCYTLTSGYTDGRGSWSTRKDDWVYFTNDIGWNNVMAFFSDGDYSESYYLGWCSYELELVDPKYNVYGAPAKDYEYVTFNNAGNEFTKRHKVSDLVGKCTNVVTDWIYNSAFYSYDGAQNDFKNGDGYVVKKRKTVSLAASFNNWSISENVFNNGNGGDTKLIKKLPYGLYEFKLVYDGIWYGSDGLTVDNKTDSAVTVYAGQGNMKLRSNGGTYIFYFNSTDHKLTITRTVSDSSYESDGTEIYLSGTFNRMTQYDAMKPLPTSMSYYPACNSSATSLITGLDSIGVDSSKEYRLEIAKANGITNYTYTAEQNTQLYNLLKSGKLIDPEAATTVYLTKNIAAGEYEFYILEHSCWLGRPGTVYDYTEYTYTVESGAPGTDFVATGASYTFYYNWKDKTVRVTASYSSNPTSKTSAYLTASFNNWALNKKMTVKDAEVVKMTVDLDPGAYYFKVIHNDKWLGGNAWSINNATTESEVLYQAGDDIELIATGGTYTFEYNVRSHRMSVICNKSLQTEAEKFDVALVGEFNNWDTSATKMEVYVDESGNLTSQTTVRFKPGLHNIKVFKNNLWYGDSKTHTDVFENATLYATSGNTVIDLDVYADCTFIFNPVSNRLTFKIDKVIDQGASDFKVALAGNFNSWSQTKNAMTASSGNVVKTTVTLSAGQYEFKIVKDDLWYGNGATFNDTTTSSLLASTGTNCRLTASGGKYTFAYDVSTDKLTITAVIDDSDPADGCTAYLSGDFNGWSTSVNKMTKTSAKVVSETVSLKAGQYCFKIVRGELWYGNTKSFTNTTSGLSLSYTSGNCTIVTTGGDYTFNLDVVTNKLSVTYVPSTDDEAVDAVVALSGSFNEWSTSSVMFDYHSTNKVAVTYPLDYGTYEFKIVYEGLWYGMSTPINDETTDMALTISDGECVLNATGGDYTFIFDVVTKKLTVTAEISATDPAESAIVSLAGDFNGWVEGETMMEYSGNNTVSVLVDIYPGTHLFKIVYGGLWYGLSKEIDNSTNMSGPIQLSGTGGECILNAEGGSYKFIFNVITHELEIVFYIGNQDFTEGAEVSLAGEFNGWDPYANPMETCSSCELSAEVYLNPGSYKFKIVDGEFWYGNTDTVIEDATHYLSVSNTGGDITLKANYSGVYKFVYHIVYKKLTITYTVDESAVLDNVKLSGEFNSWSLDDVMTYDGAGIYSITKKLDKGTYKFKVVNSDYWYGNNGTIVNTTHTTSTIGWEMDILAGDCTLKADGGSYTFIYDVTKNFLKVIYNG